MSVTRFAALQHRDFRLLWFGRLLSSTGSQMQQIAINWHIYDLLRGSTYTVSLFGREFALDAGALGLGSLGLARVIPVILFALVGGMLADSRDRRKLLIWVQSAAALFSGTLAYLTLTDQVTILQIYLLSMAGAAAAAFDEPARQSIVSNIVPRMHMTNAVSLNILLGYLATIGGPALAGVLVGQFDVGLVYVLDAVSFTAVILSLLLLRYRGTGRSQTGIGITALVEGVRYTYNNKLIWSTMLIDFFGHLFRLRPHHAAYCGHRGAAGGGGGVRFSGHRPACWRRVRRQRDRLAG